MKRVKCKTCAGTWIVEDSDLQRMKHCLYCGASLQTEVTFSELDSLDKAIYAAVQAKGRDILSNSRQFSAYLKDTAQGLEKEVRIFSKTVNDYYMGQIRTAFGQELKDAEQTINKLCHLFVEDEWLAEDAAEMLCTGIYGAIRYSRGIGSTQIVNAEISECTVVQSAEPSTSRPKTAMPTGLQREAASAEKAQFSAPTMQEAKTVTAPAQKAEPVAQQVQHAAEGHMADSDAKQDGSARKNTYGINSRYKCRICGYVKYGIDLQYKDEKCPICQAIFWEETEEETSSQPQKPKSTYDSTAFTAILEAAKKCLAANRVDEAMEKYRQAANDGYIPANTLIANLYFEQEKYKQAWKWYLKAADMEDRTGQYYVGYFYQHGLHVKKDEHRAILYYEKAAKQGELKAILALSDCYKGGVYYSKNPKMAFAYMKKAAEKGYAEAQYRMGQYFENGEGGQKDVLEALVWYQKASAQGHAAAKARADACVKEAAEKGYAEAQYRMGQYFENGEGGQKDVLEALVWYQKASAQGHAAAKARADACVAAMPFMQRLKWLSQNRRDG